MCVKRLNSIYREPHFESIVEDDVLHQNSKISKTATVQRTQVFGMVALTAKFSKKTYCKEGVLFLGSGFNGVE